MQKNDEELFEAAIDPDYLVRSGDYYLITIAKFEVLKRLGLHYRALWDLLEEVEASVEMPEDLAKRVHTALWSRS